jgi:tetratricopeptide (TPR) repeat protein
MKKIMCPFVSIVFATASVVLSVLTSGCAGSAIHLMHREPAKINPEEKMRAERYFVKARMYEMLGQNENALKCYSMAYGLDKQSMVLRDLLVDKYMQAGQFSHALVSVKGNKRLADLPDADKRVCAGIYLRQGKLNMTIDAIGLIKNKSAEDYYTLAFIYESRGDMAEAVRYYRLLLGKNPSSQDLWLRVGSLYTSLNKFSEAESLYVDMERHFGRTAGLFNGIGILKLAKGDTALAINAFKTASVVDSSDIEGLRNLGTIYTKKNDIEHAIPCYVRLYESDTASVQFGRTLAFLYFFGKQYDKAIKLITRLLAENGGDYELHFYRGLSLVASDSTATDSARAEFENAVKLQSDFEPAWEQLCYLEISAGRLDSAVVVAEKFREKMPHLNSAWRISGYVYNVRKEYDKSIALLEKAIEMDSTDAHAWFELGISLERNNQRDKAVDAFRHTLLLRPKDPAAANYLGYMWAEQGIKLDSARSLLEMALMQDSLNGAYIDSYAWILYKMGLTDSSFVYIRKAIKFMGEDPVVYNHYGDILIKKGDMSGALAAFRKSISIISSDDKLSTEELADVKKKITDIEKTRETPTVNKAVEP